MSCCQTMLMDNRKQGEREIAPEMRGRAFPAKHLAHRVKAEQNKGRLKKELHRGRGYQCGGTWVPVGKVNILVPHLLPELLATRKMLMVSGSSLVPSSIPRCPGSASPATAPGRTSLLVGHRCFLSPSTSGWKAGKLHLCSDQRYPWAPGESYNHWNSWHPHSMLRSASRSYFCHSSLFSKQITEESSTRQAPTPPSSDNTACKNCTAEFFVWLTFIFKLHSVL